jgi:integrase
LPHLFRTLNELPSETHRDYFSMLFLTGARKSNVRMMKWQDVNWEQCVWRIPITKNGDPLIVPLIPRAMDILRKRFAQSKSKWVFAHTQKKENCIGDPKHMWKEILSQATIYRWTEHETSCAWMQKIEAAIEQHIPSKKKVKIIRNRAEKENVNLPATLLDIRLHDIRRTFASYQVMTGASLVTIGKSLGHRSMDSTKVYARQTIDGVRSSIEKATEVMFSKN